MAADVFAQGGSDRMRIWVIDVERRLVRERRAELAATRAADLAAAQEIVESIVITP